ncbi:nucleotide exchange factor GrpE [Candidatus Woesearchaeota archaeon]|nr:MAG: nucleotide exchange factor GrpE [Candidatus Woesearchaeota archaeon]
MTEKHSSETEDKEDKGIPEEIKKEEKHAEKKTHKHDTKIEELTELLKRTQAEFENYKKRVEKEIGENNKFASEKVIKKLLPVIDSFELALKNHQDHEKFVKGMELIYAQLMGTLKEEGLQPIHALHKEFDPYRHEVLLTEENEKDNIVLDELQKGYLFHGKVLRHTKVKVGKHGEPAR